MDFLFYLFHYHISQEITHLKGKYIKIVMGLSNDPNLYKYLTLLTKGSILEP